MRRPKHFITVRETILPSLLLLGACRGEGATASARRDSTRMVNAAIHALAQPDSEVGMCRTHSGMFVERDTGQVPCVRVPKIETRLVAFKPDSGGACIWIENVYPEGVPRVDGGPTAVRVTRAGGLPLAARGREACIAQQPPNER